MRGAGRIRRGISRFFQHLQPRAVILLYHRVAEVASDPQLLCVKPANFAAHLACLRRDYQPLSLEALTHCLQGGRVPERAVAVAFDDGYADNLYQAKPLLEEYAVPATVFVTAGKIDAPTEFWWDELERLLLLPKSLPERVEIEIAGRKFSWLLETPGESESYRPERYHHWNITMKDHPTPRHKCYRELCRLLRPIEEGLREAVLAELRTLTGLSPAGRQDYRPLSTEEIRALASGGLVSVGAHTLTHPVLAALPVKEQQYEIAESKKRLEGLLGRPVTSFSYPYGAKADYTPETVTLVQKAGFTCACANFPAVVVRGADRFQLPRFLVRDWDGIEFARRLKEFFRE